MNNAPARPSRLARCVFILAASASCAAWAVTVEEEALFFKGVAHVNEGALHFLPVMPPAPPEKPLYHFHNRLDLWVTSLEDGWVGLDQCHYNLDAVPELQIVYGAGRIRKLTVVSSEHIGRAWIDANSVQMQDLRRGASICIRGESQVLHREGDDFVLANGPYMRRFLDGYYPMRASLEVHFAPAPLAFTDSDPAPQAGFSVWQKPGQVGYDATFEGRLMTRLRFRRQK